MSNLYKCPYCGKTNSYNGPIPALVTCNWCIRDFLTAELKVAEEVKEKFPWTPGPWYWEWHKICYSVRAHGQMHDICPSISKGEDANLIACAPEMAAAMEDYISDLVGVKPADIMLQHGDKFRKILNKAKGLNNE